jgi:hypothetical protein
MTLPLVFTCQVTVSASFVLACQSGALLPLRRNVVLWAVLLFEALVVVPCQGYLLWLLPAWTLMYSIDPATLPLAPWVWAAGCLGIALLSFGLARYWLGRDRLAAVWCLAAAGMLSTLGLAAWAGARLMWVGSYALFHSHGGDLRAVWGSPAGYLMTLAGPVQCLAWIYTIWRLHRVQRAAGGGGKAWSADSSAPQISAQLLSVAKKPTGQRSR